MLAKVKSLGLKGIDGYGVDVETDVSNGLPHFEIVGLGDTAIKEAKERVRSAIKNSAFIYPTKRITINLAPADIKKEGSLYDLAIAVAILSCDEENQIKNEGKFVYIGELSFDGSVRKIKGLLPLLISAKQLGLKDFIIPKENENEARFIDGINIYPVSSLIQTIKFLKGEEDIIPVHASDFCEIVNHNSNKYLDFSNVKGQTIAKRHLKLQQQVDIIC